MDWLASSLARKYERRVEVIDNGRYSIVLRYAKITFVNRFIEYNVYYRPLKTVYIYKSQ